MSEEGLLINIIFIGWEGTPIYVTSAHKGIDKLASS